ncbi:hypothetical protein [Desulfolutivibrio sulfoxidireducens]|uniref:hypothetical protein n=1 Tax=Desulfolutivibrio sulfoxidireducens TaxID=2773299 RepID=UPI00159E8D3A|nr:hypothetical protein [Desulfolutivibrio sulfoxidireducens]
MSSVRDEAYTVREFILSRDAMNIIDENLKLRQVFRRPKIDLLSRFDPLGIDESMESLYKYFLKKVVINVDISSSISTLQVKAFTPQDAYNINEGLLFLSEGLINKLNDRARKDMVSFAEKEVEDAEAHAKACALALTAYQDEQTLFDPTQQSTLQFQHVFKLQEDLISVRGRISQLRAYAADSPNVKALEKRAGELKKEIDHEMSKITGGSDSMSQKLIEFKRLSLDREFSEKRLATALSSLEQARAEVQRQQLYLERIVMPNKPDFPLLPNRIWNIVTVTIVSLMLYGVLKLLLAGVREHQEQ